jgi:Undecaprenyl-phosphate glucose phosphotransferase
MMPGVVEHDMPAGLAPNSPAPAQGVYLLPGPRSARPSLILPGFLSSILDGAIVIGAGMASLSSISLVKGWPALPGMLFVVTVALLAIGGMWSRGLYSLDVLFGRSMHLTRLSAAWLQAVGLGLLIALCVAMVLRHSGPWPTTTALVAAFDGMWLPLFAGSGLVGLAAVRFMRRQLLTRVPPRRAVAVGATALCQQVLEQLDGEGRIGLDVVGIVEHDGMLRNEALASLRAFYGRTVLGGMPALIDLVRRDAIDVVIVALPWSAETAIRDVVQQLAASPVDIYVAPSLDGVAFSGRPVQSIGGVPMLQIGQRPLQGWSAAMKRAEDLIAAGLMLVLSAPALLAIAAAVKLTSPGPVFFRQRRVGFNNQVFEVYKFRTMFEHMTDADAEQQTRKGDPRVTRVGAMLRKTSLDELPQLLNVLKGNMSLIGPRPHALQTRACGRKLEDVAPDYPARHRVKPGITGWAQVNGYRGELDTVEKVVHRVKHDLYYIDNWSLAFDLRILWQTARLMISDRNAY